MAWRYAKNLLLPTYYCLSNLTKSTEKYNNIQAKRCYASILHELQIILLFWKQIILQLCVLICTKIILNVLQKLNHDCEAIILHLLYVYTRVNNHIAITKHIISEIPNSLFFILKTSFVKKWTYYFHTFRCNPFQNK